MTFADGNLCLGSGQTHKCGWIKTMYLLLTILWMLN